MERVKKDISRKRGGRLAATTLLAAASGLLLGTVAATISPGLIVGAAGLLAGSRQAEAAPARQGRAEYLHDIAIDDRQVSYYGKTPEGSGPWPGVVLVPDAWGVDEETRAMADRLASLGFYVMVPDLNRGRTALDADKAREFAALMDEEEAIASIDALAGHLKYTPEVGDHRVGLVGFDLGGRLALRAAMVSTDASAVATIYGKPISDPEALRRIRCPVLGIFGGKDDAIPPKEAEDFRAALESASRTADVRIYDNAGRAFMSAGRGQHDAETADDAWSLLASFLRANL